MYDIVVYGSDNCIYCKKTKQYLDENELLYTYIDITHNKSITLDKLSIQTNNYRYVPIIFIDNNFIKGYSGLIDFFSF